MRTLNVSTNTNMDNHNKSILIDGCRELNITLTEKQTDQFTLFYDFLEEKNKVMNLTAIHGWDEAAVKHFLDSLLVCSVFDLHSLTVKTSDGMEMESPGGSSSEGSRNHVLDLGSGAGFPGIPLKIVFPDLNVTMADSLNKRVAFINEVINRLNLDKVNAVHGRAEDLGRMKEHRERYDLVVSRAVANLSSLSEYCLPFLRLGGFFISYKSTNIDTEIASAGHAIELLGGHLDRTETVSLPQSDMKRSFVIIKKVRPTPGKYPRRSGIPSRSPLT